LKAHWIINTNFGKGNLQILRDTDTRTRNQYLDENRDMLLLSHGINNRRIHVFSYNQAMRVLILGLIVASTEASSLTEGEIICPGQPEHFFKWVDSLNHNATAIANLLRDFLPQTL
jgi:hypothetical protein